MSIVIDGTAFNMPYRSLKRKADPLYSFAERTQDGVLHSELIGIYYNYTLQFGMSLNDTTEYATLWSVLTQPVTSHTITLPDESGTLSFSCYFANVTDELQRIRGGTNYFKSLTVDVIAISPARTP